MIKKILTLFILGFLTLNAHADMKVLQYNLKLVSDLAGNAKAEDLLTGGHNNLAYHADWPVSDELKQALVIVKWDGFPSEDLNDILVEIEPSGLLNVNQLKQGTPETWIYLPLGTRHITLRHPKYGSATINLDKMNNHDVWSVPVMLDKLVNVEINPLTDYNKPVRVTLVNPETGDEREAMSPAVFENVLPGDYDVRFAINGRNEQRSITVTPTQKVFGGDSFDFRHKKRVTLESTEKGLFFLDKAYQGRDATSITIDIPYGTHTVEVKVNDNLKDEKIIDVNESSEDVIYLSPIQSRTFEVVGMYQGKQVDTSILVPGLPEDRYNRYATSSKHSFTLPVNGASYTYYLFYGGHKGSKTINVTPGMNTTQEVKISADRKMIWPWERDYENLVNWWEFSYVSKQYSTSGRLYDDGSSIKTTVRENGVWDDGFDKWLHGFRMGYHAQPAFKFGLGLYTGLFTEFYFSATKDSPLGPYDKYFEWDLSLPLHILYQVPLGREFCVGFHTGPSLNLAVLGSYYDKVLPTENEDDNVEDWTDFWEEPWAPSRFNIDWDFSLFIRWKCVMITGTLSSGLTNNKMHEDFGTDAKTVMNKAMVALSIGF